MDAGSYFILLQGMEQLVILALSEARGGKWKLPFSGWSLFSFAWGKLLGSGMILATKSCDVGCFCLILLLTSHGVVNFIDSCACNVEKWVEFLGRSEGKMLLTTISFFFYVLNQTSKPQSPWHHWLYGEQHTIIPHGLFMPACKKISSIKITCPCSDLCVWDSFWSRWSIHWQLVQEFSWLWHKLMDNSEFRAIPSPLWMWCYPASGKCRGTPQPKPLTEQIICPNPVTFT